MSHNLRLPLCPKCGDTKHTAEIPNVLMILRYYPTYQCNQCRIEWSADQGITDENGVLHRVRNAVYDPPSHYTLVRQP